MENNDKSTSAEETGELESITIKVSPALYRAYQRCTWVIVNETGKEQLEIMDEMVRDFLVKHGC
jgi:hypothetical protein